MRGIFTSFKNSFPIETTVTDYFWKNHLTCFSTFHFEPQQILLYLTYLFIFYQAFEIYKCSLFKIQLDIGKGVSKAMVIVFGISSSKITLPILTNYLTVPCP